MLQSLLALPLGVGVEVLVFLALYRLTPMNGRQAAVIVAMLAITAVFIDSLLDWPGADVLAMYVAVLLVSAYLLGIISSAREQRQRAGAKDQRWFHWGPAIIVIFFVALFALDGVLVVISKQGLPQPVADRLLPKQHKSETVNSVFPGVVARDFQKKESLYNAYLEQVKQQQARGWQVSKGWLEKPLAGRPEVFQVRVTERDGAAVAFATVGGVFQRPSDSRLDQSFELVEIEPGLYRGELVLPDPGMWQLVLQIRRGDQLHEIHAETSVGAGESAP
ncbi:FixH protein [Thiogranum longum]|uniref:FixH protein n=1 Tax=Thiogranum longum TaxID=1537524 RepID=A0A4R1HCX7_9GAMM|nr:FixH family protein [Thiogranum longum]TCK17089.1 FixH protein [Thiogranum longum]